MILNAASATAAIGLRGMFAIDLHLRCEYLLGAAASRSPKDELVSGVSRARDCPKLMHHDEFHLHGKSWMGLEEGLVP